MPRAVVASLLLLCLGVGASAIAQGNLQPIPPLTQRVLDTTLTLGTEERAALVAKLAAFEQRKGSQIAVLMVASTQPEDITSYAIRAAQQYRVGRSGVGDGILVVVAKDDRRVRIDVAKALEGPVPDVMAGRIVRETFGPAFKAGEYGKGLSAGIDQLIGLVDGEPLPAVADKPRTAQPTPGQGLNWESLGMFLFAALFVVGPVLRSVLGRGLGSVVAVGGTGVVAWWLTASVLLGLAAGCVALVVGVFAAVGSAVSKMGSPGRSARRNSGRWDAPVVLGSGGFGSGGFSAGGGGGGIDFGGFSSGGGGDFGGGGASGDW